jgi:hypothetical protein
MRDQEYKKNDDIGANNVRLIDMKAASDFCQEKEN